MRIVKMLIAAVLGMLGIGIAATTARAAAGSEVRSQTICVTVTPISVLGRPITTDTYQVCVPAP
jgi:hypothetical protein